VLNSLFYFLFNSHFYSLLVFSFYLLVFLITVNTLFYCIGDNSTAICGSAVAGHHGFASGTGFPRGFIDYLLDYPKAFVAETVHISGDMNLVVVVNLGVEVDLHMNNHHGKLACFRRKTYGGEKVCLSKVEEFHDNSVVHMTHLVDVVES